MSISYLMVGVMVMEIKKRRTHAHRAFSTFGMEANKAFNFWQETVSDNAEYPIYVNGIKAVNQFGAKSQYLSLGEVGLFTDERVSDFDYMVRHDSTGTPSGSDDKIYLFNLMVGKIPDLQYANRDVGAIVAGDWIIEHGRDPLKCQFLSGAARFCCLTIPVSVAEEHIGNYESNLGRNMPRNQSINYLVTNYIHTLSTSGHIIGADGARAISRNLLELISIAYQPNAETIEQNRVGLDSGLLLSITQYVDREFSDHDISPARIAHQFGISVRYLHYLFEHTGTTFNGYLYKTRLEHAHYLISSPLSNRQTLLDIALDCGFNSLTHFGRRYREEYGESPSEARKRVIKS